MKKFLLSLVATTLAITASAETATFTKVTSTSDLQDGAEYVIITNPVLVGKIQYGPAVMSSAKSTNKGFDAYELEDGATTIADSYDIDLETSKATVLTLASTTNGWNFKIGTQYLDASSDKALKASTTATVYTITTGNDATTIAYGTSNGKIQCSASNGTGGVKGTYTVNNYTTVQKTIWLYKKSNAPVITKQNVTLAWTPATMDHKIGETFTAPVLSAKVNGADDANALAAVKIASNLPNVIYVDEDGQIKLGKNQAGKEIEGTATLTASIDAANASYTAEPAVFTITVIDPSQPMGDLTVNGTKVSADDSEATVNVYINEPVTLNVPFAESLTVYYIAPDESEKTIEEESDSYTFTPAVLGDYLFEVTATQAEEEVTFGFTLTVSERPQLQTVTKTAFFNFNQKDAYGIATHSTNVNSGTYESEDISFSEKDVTMAIDYHSGNGYRIWEATDKDGIVTGYDFRIQKVTNDQHTFTLSVPVGITIEKITFDGTTIPVSTDFNVGSYANGVWTSPETKVNSVTVTVNNSFKIKSITVEYATEVEAPAAYTLSINDKPATELPAQLDIKDVKSHTIKITAPAGHHIYHKFVDKPAAASAPRKALSVNKDEYTHVESNEATVTLDKEGTFTFFTEHPETGAYHEPVTLSVIDSGTTSIAEISADKAAAIYDLQGRKVTTARNGLFIQSGKVVRL